LRGEGVGVAMELARGCWGVLGAVRGEEVEVRGEEFGVDIVVVVVSPGEAVVDVRSRCCPAVVDGRFEGIAGKGRSSEPAVFL